MLKGMHNYKATLPFSEDKLGNKFLSQVWVNNGKYMRK
jgi:hypothetical protein